MCSLCPSLPPSLSLSPSLPLSFLVQKHREDAFYEPERGPHQTSRLWHLDLGLPSRCNSKKQTSVGKAPYLSYFISLSFIRGEFGFGGVTCHETHLSSGAYGTHFV